MSAARGPVSTSPGDGSALPSRTLLHTRRIELQGYRLADGNYEIEATLTDLKTGAQPRFGRPPLPPGQPLHGMQVRMRIDPAMTILAFDAAMPDTPYTDCPQAAPNFGRLVGLKIQGGFLREAQRRVGGVEGCTHLRELLQQIATTAFQTTVGERISGAQTVEIFPPGETPKLIGSCAGYRTDGEAVRIRWPQFHTPPK